MGNRITVPPGTRFGKLTAIEELPPRRSPSGDTARQFRFRCDCGNECITLLCYVRIGTTSSCGCYRRSFMATHGMYKKKVYRTWLHMRERCLNPNCRAYPDYGGRGITVCERWNVFEEFYKDMGNHPPGLSLDRRDNNGPYSPENCRWATAKEQMSNRRCSRIIEYNGRKQTLGEWARETGIAWATLHNRFKKNWPIQLALTLPPKARHTRLA